MLRFKHYCCISDYCFSTGKGYVDRGVIEISGSGYGDGQGIGAGYGCGEGHGSSRGRGALNFVEKSLSIGGEGETP